MKAQRGFNLIEALMVVAMIAILSVIGTPSLRYMLINNRITTKTNDLVAAFNFVRSEAITHNSDKYKVRPQPAPNGTDWSQGWIIWKDMDKNDEVNVGGTVTDPSGTVTQVDGEEKLKVFDGAEKIVISKLKGPKDVVRYNNRGRLRDGEFEFSICLKDWKYPAPKGRKIKVGRTGRVTLVDREYTCVAPPENP